MLGEQQVQPAQPVGSGDGDDPAVGEVDEAAPVGEGALFAVELSVVGGDALVTAFGGYGTGKMEQGAAGHATKRTTPPGAA